MLTTHRRKLLNGKKIIVATYKETLNHGGSERVVLNLLDGLPRETVVQRLITFSNPGPLLEAVPAHVKTYFLQVNRFGKRLISVAAVISLTDYLKRYEPDVLIAHSTRGHLVVLAAVAFANTSTRIVLVQHVNHAVLKDMPFRFFRSWLYRCFTFFLYKRADRVVGVSEGVSSNIKAVFSVPSDKITTIYNPVVSSELLTKAKATLEHAWFGPDQPPVILAAGRLVPIKDFITLIRAFAKVRDQLPCRLIILGEGSERDQLEAEIDALHLADSVQMPGHEANPYRYMKRASAFVLSSRSEGLSMALVEAMACGCPVVTTECGEGPREALESGRWGRIVPVADPDKLAAAIISTLREKTPLDGSPRAEFFSVSRSLQAYTTLIHDLTGSSQVSRHSPVRVFASRSSPPGLGKPLPSTANFQKHFTRGVKRAGSRSELPQPKDH